MMTIKNAVENHKLVRRLALAWAVALITWVVWRVFTTPPDVPNGTVTALGIVVGILSVVVGLYQWSRREDDAAARLAAQDVADNPQSETGGPDRDQ